MQKLLNVNSIEAKILEIKWLKTNCAVEFEDKLLRWEGVKTALRKLQLNTWI